jgi:K+-transporting ATPase A subunit
MTANGWFQIGFFLLVIFLITKPLGVFLAHVFSGEKTFLDPVLRPIEKFVYRLTGIDEKHEMRWTEYAVAMLLFSAVSMALLYLMWPMFQTKLYFCSNPNEELAKLAARSFHYLMDSTGALILIESVISPLQEIFGRFT